MLDKGKHPTFIGRETVRGCARNGGVTVYTFAGEDVAVSIVNPSTNTLLVLNVKPVHRSHGLGAAILAYLQVNFARVIESAVPWFERQGYTVAGEPKQGNKFITRVMFKATLAQLSGRLAKVYS